MLLAEGEAGLGSWTGKGAQAVFFLQTGITAPVDDLETAIFLSASQLSKKRDVCSDWCFFSLMLLFLSNNLPHLALPGSWTHQQLRL